MEFLLKQSGKASLGVDIYYGIAAESIPVEEIFVSLNMETEHFVLDTINRLEGAIFVWKQQMSYEIVKKSPMRHPWSFVKEHRSEIDKIAVYLERTEALLRLLKIRFPNLPQSFIDVTKVQYNKVINFSTKFTASHFFMHMESPSIVSSSWDNDQIKLLRNTRDKESFHVFNSSFSWQDIGHAIVEAYSRVLVSLSFNILSRIGDILQEDDSKKSNTPISNLKFDFTPDVYRSGITETPHGLIKRSLIQQMNMADDRCIDSYIKKASSGAAYKLQG